MPTTSQKRLRAAVLRVMRDSQNTELALATAALERTNAPVGVRHALLCLAGRKHPLPTPTGADLTFREDVARYLSRQVEFRLVDEPYQHFLAFEVGCERWVRPAQTPAVAFDQMMAMAVRRLKRPLPNLAYAPAIQMRREAGRPVELSPRLRVFALVGESNIETIERSVAMICRDLDPRGTEGRTGPSVQPIGPGKLMREAVRMLGVHSERAAPLPSASSASNQLCTSALCRMAIAAAMPIKGAVSLTRTALHTMHSWL